MNNPDKIALVFSSRIELKKAFELISKNQLEIVDIYAPCHLPEYDEIHKNNKVIPVLGLIGGFIGLTGSFLFLWWISTTAYPTNFGNKPLLAIPSFIPVLFECMVLLASFFMFYWFYFWLKKKKSFSNQIKNLIADDKFVILLETKANLKFEPSDFEAKEIRIIE